MDFWNQKLVRTSYHCLESTITAHLNHSFLPTLALKTRTCVMALLVQEICGNQPIHASLPCWLPKPLPACKDRMYGLFCPNLVCDWLKSNPNLIAITVPYNRLPMGSWAGMGASTLVYLCASMPAYFKTYQTACETLPPHLPHNEASLAMIRENRQWGPNQTGGTGKE